MSQYLHRRTVLTGLTALAGCAQPGAGGLGTGGGGPAFSSYDTAGPPLPFDSAVQRAADRVLSTTPGRGARQPVIIDPLVDGITGEQSLATQSIQERIVTVARTAYPQFDIQPFSSRAVSQAPLVMVGTFTPVNGRGQSAGARDNFRFCLVMGDLQSGKAVAKSVTRAQFGGADTTPTAFFRDSPAWTDDAITKSYIATCQATKVGDPLPPAYINAILANAIIADAIEAYNAARYAEALDQYRSALRTQAGDQLRAHNGIYLSNLKLNRRPAAEQAFGDLVDFSLANRRLAVKLLFRPGSTGLLGDTGQTDMWLQQIASRAARRNTCLQVSGHTTRSGAAALNERLSLLRAEYVKARLEDMAPPLRGKLIAAGFGANENLVGTGADDATDALDRRVEFRVLESCA